MLIDLLPLLLLLIFFWGFRPVEQLSSVNKKYLSIETFNNYKGFFALVIVLHHLSHSIQGGVLFREFYNFGYLAVAAFFFYSGYGLQKSYISKREKYYNGFLKKRIPSVLFPYIIVTFIYWLSSFLSGRFYTLTDIFTSIISGSPIVSNSWFVIAILIFYLVFWLLMTLCKNNYKSMILGGSIWFVAYAICCEKLGFPSWWYNAAHVLLIGLSWATWEQGITRVIKKHQLMIPIVWAFFIITFIAKRDIDINNYNALTSLVLSLVTSLLFVIGIIFFSLKVQIGNKVLSFVGNISFEVYMIHGLFITLLSSDLYFAENEYMLACGVIGLSLLSGYILHNINGMIISMYKKIVGF